MKENIRAEIDFPIMCPINDLLKSAEHFSHAISLHRGQQLPGLLRDLGMALAFAGFIKEPVKYYREAMKLDGDSTSSYGSISWIYQIHGDFEKSLEFAERVYAIDSNNIDNLEYLGWILLRLSI